MEIKTAASWLLLSLNRLPGGLAFTTWLYRATAVACARLLHRPGVAAHYVRGSMGRGNIVPGLSDIDLNVVIQDLDDDPGAALVAGYTRDLVRLQRLVPIIAPYLHTVKDIEVAVRSATLYYQTPHEDWLLLSGRPVLPRVDHPPARMTIGWIKVGLRRFFGGQRGYYNREAGRTKRVKLKLNENLLSDLARLVVAVDRNRLLVPGRPLRELAREAGDPDVMRLVDLNEECRANRYVVPDIADFSEKLFECWHGLLKTVARKVDVAAVAREAPLGDYTMTPRSIPPETRARVREGLEPLLRELRALSGHRFAFVLSSVGCRNYAHRMYAVVRDDAPIAEVRAFQAALHGAFTRHRSSLPLLYYGSMWAPPVISESAFRILGFGERSGLEPIYFPRHGETAVNTLGRPLPVMEPSIAAASLLSETAAHLGYARRRRDFRAKPGLFRKSFVDYVTGTLPSLRLLLEKKIIVTTPGEAFAAYLEGIPGEFGGLLESFYPEFAGKAPESIDERRLKAIYRRNWKLLKRQADAITDLYRRHLDARDARLAGSR